MSKLIQAAMLKERRACLKIVNEYLRNEIAWRDAYERKGPPEMHRQAIGGSIAAMEIKGQILERSKRRKPKSA